MTSGAWESEESREYRRSVEEMLFGSETLEVLAEFRRNTSKGPFQPNVVAVTSLRVMLCDLRLNRGRLEGSWFQSIPVSQIVTVELEQRCRYDRDGNRTVQGGVVIITWRNGGERIDLQDNPQQAQDIHDQILERVLF